MWTNRGVSILHPEEIMLPNSLKHSPCETNSHRASQEIPCLLMESQGLLPHSQKSAIGPYPEPNKYNPQPPTLLLPSIHD